VLEPVQEGEDLRDLVEPVALAGAQLLDDAYRYEFLDRVLRPTPRSIQPLCEIAGVERRHVGQDLHGRQDARVGAR
jgi:hypothetical protein